MKRNRRLLYVGTSCTGLAFFREWTYQEFISTVNPMALYNEKGQEIESPWYKIKTEEYVKDILELDSAVLRVMEYLAMGDVVDRDDKLYTMLARVLEASYVRIAEYNHENGLPILELPELIETEGGL